jgi:hypothetical protein
MNTADFVDLLAEALDIRPGEIHVAADYGDHNPDKLVSFDIEMGATHGLGGSRLPMDEETEMSRPTVAVGPSAFIDESHLYPLSTAIHEAAHVSHAMMAEDQLEKWRSADTKMNFYASALERAEKKRINQSSTTWPWI